MKQFLKFVSATLAGLILFSFISFILLLAGIAAMIPAPEPVKENSVLHLRLEGDLTERSEKDLFALLGSEETPVIGLDDILASIRAAKENPDIKGIYLNPGLFRAGYASLNEIRTALMDFRESGKFVFAYSGNYTQGAYYLCSVADMFCLNREGIVDFRGIASSTLFFKNLLEKIGVEMQVVKVGTYKSFTEQFTNEGMSEANREQMTLLTQTIWDNTLHDISSVRNVSKSELIAAADGFLTFQPAEKALEMKMVDSLIYPDQIDHILNGYLETGRNAKVSFVKPVDLIDATDPNDPASEDKIALVYATGEIDNGSTKGIQTGKLYKLLQRLERDSSVKAVVLRINSPGGSAYGSEQIWHAVSLLKQSKPVIASMGDYAASGGYYIACNATKIIANPNTITGSIGIFGVIPNVEGLMGKAGISHDIVKTGEFADMPTVYRAMTGDERRIIQQYVNRGYDLFLRRCAEGRNIARDSIAAIAEGRVWSGVSALSLGLVDRLGTLQDAIQLAAEEAGLTFYDIEEYPEKEDWFTRLTELPESGMEKLFFKSAFTEERAILNKLYKIDRLQAALPFDLNVE
ncbi:MAG: signal peptide peptidase SppA [Prevotellaceae bacterium]|jgi:protease-4|nr:signal peptide peptidase SppA [Prevotellaceae bacterium]